MKSMPETNGVAPKRAKRKRGLRVLLIVLSVLLLTVGCAAFVFRNEISLIYYALTVSGEQQQAAQSENDKKTQQMLDKLSGDLFRDLTDEERRLLASGKLTEEEALALIRGETAVTTSPTVPDGEPRPPLSTDTPTTAKPAVTSVTDTTAAVTTKKQSAEPIDPAELTARKNDIIAKIYLLRATYLNKIDYLVQNTVDTYIALPSAQHTLTEKLKAIDKFVNDGNALEKECDKTMKSYLTELKDILESGGESSAIISEIEKAYAEQKKIKKSAIYSEYSAYIK